MQAEKQTRANSNFFSRNIHIFMLGAAFTASFLFLVVVYKFGEDKAAGFGPKAQTYILGIKNGLIFSTLLLLISLLFSMFPGKYLRTARESAVNFYNSFGDTKRNLLILALCFTFLFVSHAGNITNGYFNMDDLEIIRLNNTLPFGQSLLIPHGNDHLLPLFTAEMKMLYSAFGTNEIPYNILIFVMLALTPFFTYLSMKRLGFNLEAFLVFLIIFSGAANWAEMLTGFYIMSVYPQIIFFFSVTVWSYLAWTESKRFTHLIFFALSISMALLVDTSGIWVLPATALLMICVHLMKSAGLFENK